MILTLLITSSVLILGIFCVREMTYGRITMRARYALWLLVALRLLVPFSMGQSPISVMNFFAGVSAKMQQAQEAGDRADHAAGESEDVTASGMKNGIDFGNVVSGQHEAADQLIPGQIVNAGEADAVRHIETRDGVFGTKKNGFLAEETKYLQLLIYGVWMFGFVAVSGYMLLSRQRFMRYLYKSRTVLPEGGLPETFAKRIRARGMRVYQVQGLPSPCLVGRDIYVGARAASDSHSLSHILAHEYCHALHRDGLWAFLRSFLAAVYWFDPLVWAAAYAARQDSELACDEAAVGLLGETERFAYGRTLLNLLENGDGREECPGMAFMLNQGEKSVRQRIGALAGYGRKRGAAAALALAAALFLCGCAFTGAVQKDAEFSDDAAIGQDGENADAQNASANGQDAAEKTGGSADGQDAAVQGDTDGRAKGSGQISDESAADDAAFEEALNYHGVMEGKDDGELALRREVDYQTYFQYTRGETENPMENGWYLLCENEDAGIALYGLYTEEFGYRGLKTLIGGDVNTFDGKWCVSLLNGGKDSIRVLERADDGLPRRFVWKLLAEESGTAEIWHLYSANRYDTGTVEVKTLTEEECLVWAKEHLDFSVDQDAAKVHVTYDGDMVLDSIDISAYQGFQVERVQVVPDLLSFMLDDPGAAGYQIYSDAVYEKIAAHLSVGFQFAGVEGLWFDGLPVLCVQIVEDESSAFGFRLTHPRIDETYVWRARWQEEKLAELRDGISAEQAVGSEEADGSGGAAESAETGKNDLEEPLVNGAEAHHDLAIDFGNPCPDFERISNAYGERVHPATGNVTTHTGVDLAAPEGADVLAAADGTVFLTGFDAVNGNYVVLWHEQSGQMTYYEHCKTIEADKGQRVARGEKIATVGKTGQATGSYLHFAVSSGNNWEEPFILAVD